MMTTDFRAKRADQVRETMRHIRMPVDVLEMAAGPDELSEYATTVASLAAGCMVDNKAVSSTELARSSLVNAFTLDDYLAFMAIFKKGR